MRELDISKKTYNYSGRWKKGFTIRGQYNEILTNKIGSGSIISGWCFIGRNVELGRRVKISNFVNLDSGCKIGDDTNIQTFVVLNSNTVVGKRCLISTHVTTLDEKYPTPLTETIKRIPCNIGNDCVIGGGAVLVSAMIGNKAVIGAGSVVLNNIPNEEVWAGVQAKFIMKRKSFDEKIEIYKIGLKIK